MADELSRILLRIEALEARIEGLSRNQSPNRQVMVATVFDGGSMPTTVPAFFDTYRCELSGVEGEGKPIIISPNKDWIVSVAVLGPRVPAVGDNLIAKVVSTRDGTFWVARKGKSSGTPPPPPPVYVVIPGCSCQQIPAVLSMTSSGPCYPGDFQPCTLAYGPTPSQFSALGLGASCFLSTADFQDPTQAPPFGLFRYTFGCTANFFSLSRVYEPTSSSQAYHDTTIYSWAIGITGNSCNPFRLTNGTIYAGGNPNCLVVISAT